jgi:hypothetical protein
MRAVKSKAAPCGTETVSDREPLQHVIEQSQVPEPAALMEAKTNRIRNAGLPQMY